MITNFFNSYLIIKEIDNLISSRKSNITISNNFNFNDNLKITKSKNKIFDNIILSLDYQNKDLYIFEFILEDNDEIKIEKFFDINFKIKILFKYLKEIKKLSINSQIFNSFTNKSFKLFNKSSLKVRPTDQYSYFIKTKEYPRHYKFLFNESFKRKNIFSYIHIRNYIEYDSKEKSLKPKFYIEFNIGGINKIIKFQSDIFKLDEFEENLNIIEEFIFNYKKNIILESLNITKEEYEKNEIFYFKIFSMNKY